MRFRRALPWLLLICELAVLVCLLGALALGGVSAGFEWWPMPTFLGLGWCLTGGCVYFARSRGRSERWILCAASLLPAAYLSFFIARESWKSAHPINQTWIIPAGYHGPIYVVRGIQKGAIATRDRNDMVFVLDSDGIAAIRESSDSRWVHSSYEYRASDGTTSRIAEAEPGAIDDTPENRRDKTRRIYFAGSGGFADGSGCLYSVNEAYVESPSEALDERASLSEAGARQDSLLEELKRRYPGQCSTAK